MAKGLRERRRGLRGGPPGDGDQPLLQALIPESGVGELVARPVVGIRPTGRLRGGAKRVAPVARERVDMDCLYAGLKGVVAIIPPPARGVADIDPVRRPIAATAVAAAVDEGLHQHRALAIERGPVVGEAPEHPLDCEPAGECGDKVGGLDWGLATSATMATPDGTEPIDNPRHLARTLSEIRRVQRAISRKEEAAKKASGTTRRLPVSNRLQNEYERLRRLHRKVANQRNDLLDQTTAWLVGQFAVLGLEDLNIRNMTASGGQNKKGLNRPILDAAGGAFHQLLGYKAEEARTWAMEAPTRQIKPSQTCHACGRQAKKPLGQRRHECPCGACCTRDENAARMLLMGPSSGYPVGNRPRRGGR